MRAARLPKPSRAGPIWGDAHDHDGEFTQGFDVTDVLQKLRLANGNVLPELEVSLVPHSTSGESDADLANQKIEVPITNITLKLVTEEQK
jgi:hypothetical protein